MLNNHDAAVAAGKTAPPVIVSAVSALGFGLSDVLIIITIVYTLLQLWFLFRDRHLRDPERLIKKKTAEKIIQELDGEYVSPALINAATKFIEVNKEPTTQPKEKDDDSVQGNTGTAP